MIKVVIQSARDASPNLVAAWRPEIDLLVQILWGDLLQQVGQVIRFLPHWFFGLVHALPPRSRRMLHIRLGNLGLNPRVDDVEDLLAIGLQHHEVAVAQDAFPA
jgi:hypothetical protein